MSTSLSSHCRSANHFFIPLPWPLPLSGNKYHLFPGTSRRIQVRFSPASRPTQLRPRLSVAYEQERRLVYTTVLKMASQVHTAGNELLDQNGQQVCFAFPLNQANVDENEDTIPAA